MNINLLTRENGKLVFQRDVLDIIFRSALNKCKNEDEIEFLRENIEGVLEVAIEHKLEMLEDED